MCAPVHAHTSTRPHSLFTYIHPHTYAQAATKVNAKTKRAAALAAKRGIKPPVQTKQATRVAVKKEKAKQVGCYTGSTPRRLIPQIK